MTNPKTFNALAGQVPAATLAAMTAVTVKRTPKETVVFIDGVQLPQSVTSLSLPTGAHTLKVRIDGAAGDTGSGEVLNGQQSLSTETARIPAGFDQALSAEGRFNV